MGDDAARPHITNTVRGCVQRDVTTEETAMFSKGDSTMLSTMTWVERQICTVVAMTVIALGVAATADAADILVTSTDGGISHGDCLCTLLV